MLEMMGDPTVCQTYQNIHVLQLHDVVLDQEGSHQVETVGRHLSLLVVGGQVETELEVEQLTHGPGVGQELAQQRDEELVMFRLTLKTL